MRGEPKYEKRRRAVHDGRHVRLPGHPRPAFGTNASWSAKGHLACQSLQPTE